MLNRISIALVSALLALWTFADTVPVLARNKNLFDWSLTNQPLDQNDDKGQYEVVVVTLHNLWLQLLAFMIGCFGTFTVLQIMSRVSTSYERPRSEIIAWVMGSSSVFGMVSIWGTNFIGQSALKLELLSSGDIIDVTYDLRSSLLSLFLSLMFSMLGFLACSYQLLEAQGRREPTSTDDVTGHLKPRSHITSIDIVGRSAEDDTESDILSDISDDIITPTPESDVSDTPHNTNSRVNIFQMASKLQQKFINFRKSQLSNLSFEAVSELASIKYIPPHLRKRRGRRRALQGSNIQDSISEAEEVEEETEAEEDEEVEEEDSESEEESEQAEDIQGNTLGGLSSQHRHIKRLATSVTDWTRDRFGDMKPSVLQVIIGGLLISIGMSAMQYVLIASQRILQVHMRYGVWSLFSTWILSHVLGMIMLLASFNARQGWHMLLVSLFMSCGLSSVQHVAARSCTYIYDHGTVDSVEQIGLSNVELSLIVTTCTCIICFISIARFSSKISHHHTLLRETLQKLAEEQARTESLLRHVLPRRVARLIKYGEHTVCKKHLDTTIIFVDIVSFTRICDSFPPSVIVSMLHTLFSAFDDLARQYKVEKIKTIGDCWMGAAGLDGCHDHAARAVRLCISMVQFVALFNREHEKYRPKEYLWRTGKDQKAYIDPTNYGAPYIQIRCGVNTGTCISGVIGQNRFQFDVWGSAVNVAARMETHCPFPQSVHVSEATYNALQWLARSEDPEWDIEKRRESPNGRSTAEGVAPHPFMSDSELCQLFKSHNPNIRSLGRMQTFYFTCLTPEEQKADAENALRQEVFMEHLSRVQRDFIRNAENPLHVLGERIDTGA